MFAPAPTWRAWAIRSACILSCILFVAGECSAQSVRSSVERQPALGIYIPPNEQHPAVALPIFRKSNHGVYISVGTERAFIGTALTRAAALFVIDYDPDAIRIASINRALLAASTDRGDYLSLRWKASQEVWRRRSHRLKGADEETLANADSWTFWGKKVRNNESAWDNAFKHFHTEPKQPTDPFLPSIAS